MKERVNERQRCKFDSMPVAATMKEFERKGDQGAGTVMYLGRFSSKICNESGPLYPSQLVFQFQESMSFKASHSQTQISREGSAHPPERSPECCKITSCVSCDFLSNQALSILFNVHPNAERASHAQCGD